MPGVCFIYHEVGQGGWQRDTFPLRPVGFRLFAHSSIVSPIHEIVKHQFMNYHDF